MGRRITKQARESHAQYLETGDSRVLYTVLMALSTPSGPHEEEEDEDDEVSGGVDFEELAETTRGDNDGDDAQDSAERSSGKNDKGDEEDSEERCEDPFSGNGDNNGRDSEERCEEGEEDHEEETGESEMSTEEHEGAGEAEGESFCGDVVKTVGGTDETAGTIADGNIQAGGEGGGAEGNNGTNRFSDREG